MKKFSIELFDERIIEIDDGYGYPFTGCKGEITIGNYKEEFLISISTLWTYEEYKKHWKEAIERIKTHDKSCLVLGIHMVEKYKRPAMTIFRLHKVRDLVFFSKQLISTQLTKGLPTGPWPAYSQTCYQLVDERIENARGESIDHNGYELWEKSIKFKDLFDSTPSLPHEDCDA